MAERDANDDRDSSINNTEDAGNSKDVISGMETNSSKKTCSLIKIFVERKISGLAEANCNCEARQAYKLLIWADFYVVVHVVKNTKPVSNSPLITVQREVGIMRINVFE